MPEVDFFERRVGTLLRGKWKLERLLGVGGMAAVYEAVHAQLGRREAVKILHPQIAHAPEARLRFEQEARAVAHLQHPGAVAVHDIDVSEEGAPYLVMELLSGESLADSLHRRGALGAEEVARLADQVLDVLAAAHAVGIIHRDIKPDNLFLCADGRLRVLDFGVARLRQGDGQPAAPTRTGALIGTVAYMPPEQVIGRSDLDGRADLFSVGATLFRLLTGRHLHPSDNEVKQLMEMATVPAPPVLQFAPHTPPALAAVVDRALAFDRERRFPTADAMRHALREAMPPHVFLPPPEGPAPHSPRPSGAGVSVPQSFEPTVLPGGGPAPIPPGAFPTEQQPVMPAPSNRSALLTPMLGAPSPGFPLGTATPWQVTAPVPVAAPPADGRVYSDGTTSASPGTSVPVTQPFVQATSVMAAPREPSTWSQATPPPSSPSRASGDAYPIPPPPTAASESPLTQLGRRTVALPMPVMLGGAGAVIFLVVALVGSLIWSHSRTDKGAPSPDPVFSPQTPGMTAGAPPTTAAPQPTTPQPITSPAQPVATPTPQPPVVQPPVSPPAQPTPHPPAQGPSKGKGKGKKK